MSRRISSLSVPSAATLSACVWPRVNSAEPCVRGVTPTSIEMSRISSSARPSGRFLWTAMRSRMIAFSSLSNASCAAARRSLAACELLLAAPSGAAGRVAARGSPASTALVASWRSSLSSTCVASSSAAPWEARICSSSSSSTADASNGVLLLADLRGELALQRAQLLDLGVRDVERVEDLRLGDLVGAGLDHQDRVLGAGDDRSRSERVLASASRSSSAGLTTKLPSTLPIRTAPTGVGERDVGDHQRRRGAVHREDVVGVDVVDRERDRDQLRLVAPALREQRADRAVDHARGQRGLLARAALALEERAGDLPGGVHALLDVDRQREEVDVAQAAGGGGREDHRVALADDHCAGGLLGHPAGLERDLAAGDLHGDPRNGVTAHILLPSSSALRSAALSLLSLFRTESSLAAGRRICCPQGAGRGRLRRS